MAASVSDQHLYQSTDLLSKVLSINIRYLVLSSFVIFVVLPVCRFVHRDYYDFLALGPGGTPSTFAGYLRICYLRLFALEDPLKPPPSTNTERPANGFLLRLPRRLHPRPSVAGIAPHRQTNQKPPAQLYHRLRIALYSLVGENPKLLHAAVVISRGWGERHPLAGCPILGIGKRLLPEGFVMVYAPQDETQIGVIMDIVRAAGWWVGGVGLACKAEGQGVTTRDTVVVD
ncbi:MAG: hypothetical protein LQ343_002093 [Gyalolechia ehrenbergii]|nr:MAG: hypothetical protein LQ343_002093 [Gyalolechia ehrenbergii]